MIFLVVIIFVSGERVLKPFKQSVGFQEKHAVATLQRSQMRLPCRTSEHRTFKPILSVFPPIVRDKFPPIGTPTL